jgi:hypothetical protein
VNAVIKIKAPIEDKLISGYNKTEPIAKYNINRAFLQACNMLGINLAFGLRSYIFPFAKYLKKSWEAKIN